MRRTTAWLTLWVLAHGVVFTPLVAQPQADTEVGPPATTFIDSKIFDRKLRKMMKARPERIAIDFAQQPSPNDLPERLDAWLTAVEKHGGTVEIEPSEPTRGLASVLVYLAGAAFRAVKQKSQYAATKNYDAVIYYSLRTGLVERVVFQHKTDSHGSDISTMTREDSWLILPEEAAELDLPDKEWSEGIRGTRAPSRGPRISVLEPVVVVGPEGPTIESSSPLSLQILFEKNEAPVDMESLKVVAHRKSIPRRSVSLTDRIQGYLDGQKIAANGIKIPRGRYLIELVIADEEGYETIESFRLRIVKR